MSIFFNPDDSYNFKKSTYNNAVAYLDKYNKISFDSGEKVRVDKILSFMNSISSYDPSDGTNQICISLDGAFIGEIGLTKLDDEWYIIDVDIYDSDRPGSTVNRMYLCDGFDSLLKWVELYVKWCKSSRLYS